MFRSAGGIGFGNNGTGRGPQISGLGRDSRGIMVTSVSDLRRFLQGELKLQREAKRARKIIREALEVER